jgi:ABC-type branched-subunit amino acid transport system ATPase component
MNMENETTDRPMLEAINLSKRYEDGVLALDHVSFEVKPGEIFAMLGGNGAGKTTAINISRPPKGQRTDCVRIGKRYAIREFHRFAKSRFLRQHRREKSLQRKGLSRPA